MRRQIGTTSHTVFPIGLGCYPLSFDSRPSEKEAIKVIHAALDAGVDFIDTSNAYCIDDKELGHNEGLIRKALASWPGKKNIYVATKGGYARPNGVWEKNGAPNELIKACEKSLYALGVEQIFLYQLHAPDDRYPFMDQIGALAALQELGKIKYIGISNVNAEQIEEAQRLTRIETVQNHWNPDRKEDEWNGVFDACKHFDMSYIAYSPVGGQSFHKELAKNAVLMDIAAKHRVSTYEVMLAWTLSKEDFIIPIPGASHVASIMSSVKAVSLVLDNGDMLAIDSI